MQMKAVHARAREKKAPTPAEKNSTKNQTPDLRAETWYRQPPSKGFVLNDAPDRLFNKAKQIKLAHI
jgi:hypothetical protein